MFMQFEYTPLLGPLQANPLFLLWQEIFTGKKFFTHAEITNAMRSQYFIRYRKVSEVFSTRSEEATENNRSGIEVMKSGTAQKT